DPHQANNMIPEEKLPLVQKALQAAFHTDTYDSITQLTKGLSTALVFKINVDSQPYVLRIVTRTDAVADPALYYGSMQTAAEGGIAPPIYYLSIEDRVSITGYVRDEPFPALLAKQLVPQLIRKLHALPKFGFRLNYFESVSKWLPRFIEKNILSEIAHKELMSRHQAMVAAYPVNAIEEWVASHNDTKPENMVFDGTRVWLIDWEAAFLNDRYLDLAIIANFLVVTPSDEHDFLHEYLDRAATDYEITRFYVMRAILHFYYFTFLIAFDTGENPIDFSAIAHRDYRQFHKGMWDGHITLDNAQTKREYAMIHFEKFIAVTSETRMRKSLRLMSTHKQGEIARD
ncbi:MAG TPA: phosphotransferase, partial [Chitinophagaceae bacterium]